MNNNKPQSYIKEFPYSTMALLLFVIMIGLFIASPNGQLLIFLVFSSLILILISKQANMMIRKAAKAAIDAEASMAWLIASLQLAELDRVDIVRLPHDNINVTITNKAGEKREMRIRG